MTRKDYIALAAGLRLANDTATSAKAGLGAAIAITATADVLAADNPRFDRDRFLDACYGVPA